MVARVNKHERCEVLNFANFEQIVDDRCKVWTPSEFKHLQKQGRVWVTGKPRGLCVKFIHAYH